MDYTDPDREKYDRGARVGKWLVLGPLLGFLAVIVIVVVLAIAGVLS